MYVIYHSADLDGHSSGAICKKKYPEAVLIGFNYGQPYEKLTNAIPVGEPIIMADVSMPMADMERLAIHSNYQFTWIDHHKSAIEDYDAYRASINPSRQDFLTPVLKVGIAACEIAWTHLFPNKEMPRAIELLGKYDTWRQNDPVDNWEKHILPFQYGMRAQNIKDADTFPQDLLTDHVMTSDIMDIMRTGDIVLDYQKQQNQLAMKSAFVFDFFGYRALACNGCQANSQAFESLFDPEQHDIMMPFRYNGKLWIFSIYTTKDIDCAGLAKLMGGGGHAKAAGFQCENIQLLNQDGVNKIIF